jgi:mRNA interferase RelE/StbE
MKLVRYTSDAARALRRHANMAERIRVALRDYATDPVAHANNVRRLVGSNERRLRISGFRAVFEETPTEILVTRIGPRGDVYE